MVEEFELSEFEVLGQIAKTYAGPVHHVKHLPTNLSRLAFFIRPEVDAGDLTSQVIACRQLNGNSTILETYGIARADDARGLPISIITEFAPNGCLADCINRICIISRYSILPRLDIAKLLFGIANALRDLHHRGLFVGDLSPARIFLAENFRAKLALPLISAFRDPNRLASEELSVQLYVAPELWQGGEATVKSDCYAYGLICYKMWAREITFPKALSGISFVRNIISGARPIVPGIVSPIAKTMITRCWASDPNDRPFAFDLMILMNRNVEYFIELYSSDTKQLCQYQRRILRELFSIHPMIKEEEKKVFPIMRPVPAQPTEKIDSRPVFTPLIYGNGRAFTDMIIRFQRQLWQLRTVNRAEVLPPLFDATPFDRIQCVVWNLFLVSECVYYDIPVFAHFLKELCELPERRRKTAAVKATVLRLLRQSLIQGECFPKDVAKVAFVFHCMSNGLFAAAEIVGFVRQFADDWIETRKKANCLLFAWFAPEINAINKDLFELLLSVFRHVVTFPNVSFAFVHFIERFDSLREGRWSGLRQKRRDEADARQNVTFTLRRDDASVLRNAVENTNIPVNKRVMPDIHIPCPLVHDHPSLLMYAAAYQAVNCFQYLQLTGQPFVNKDDKYRSLADFAVAGGSLTIVRFVENMPNTNFDSCMQVAVRHHLGSLFVYLAKSHDVALDAADRFGKAVITSAAAMDNVNGVLYCLGRGIPVSTHETFGWTVLHCAAERGCFDVIYVLMHVDGTEPNARDTWGNTPLHLATDRVMVDVVKYLLRKKKVHVNAETCDGMTAFHIAAESNVPELLAVFVACMRVDVNARNARGMTGLHLAVRTGNPKVVEMILRRHDLLTGIRSIRGKTALDMAKKRNQAEILELFQESEKVRREKCSVM
jgi:ankyrin repeat protein/serine/threonine protein kinase